VQIKLERISTSVISHLADAVILEDGDGVILYVNPALESLLGYKSSELVGNFWGILVPEEAHSIVNSANKRRKKGITDRYELPFLNKDGSRVFALVSGTPYSFEDGSKGMLSVITDITELKLARREAEKFKQFADEIVENMADGVVVEDSEGYFTYANPAMAKILGMGVNELVGKHWSDTVAEGEEEIVRREIINRSNGKTEVYELTLKRKDGNTITGLVTAQPYRLAGQDEKSLLAVFRDVTELRAEQEEKRLLAQQILASQKMETVGRLAGGVAHDFNNLLAIIKGQADVAMMQMTPEHKPYEYFQRINATVNRAADLVKHLLMFGRRQYHEPKVMNINQLVTSMERLLRPIIVENIEIDYHLAENLQDAFIDPAQLEHAILNLAVNAGDAMPRGGKLTFSTENIKLSRDFARANPMVIPGEYVHLKIADSGVGMPQEVMDRVFDPFFTTKEEGRGTGLGLSSVYGIVKQNDGYVFVESEVNIGTTFHLYFPVSGRKPAEDYSTPR